MTIVEEGLETTAFHELHGDVVEAVLFAGIENDYDIGMGQHPGGARFGLKTSEKLGSSEAGAFGAELDGFDSDGAADNGVRGLVDDTHGAAAQFADNFVTSGLRKRRHRYVRHGRNALYPLTCVRSAGSGSPLMRPRTRIRLTLTVRSKFSVGQRDRGTSVSDLPPV